MTGDTAGSGPTAPGAVSSRVITIPNVLSLGRLALVPVFLYLLLTGQDLAALIVLVVSSITDYLDGFLARRLGQITKLGQVLDPAADRLYIIATVVGLAVREIVPWWLVAVIVGRDVMILVLGIVLRSHGHRTALPVNHLGKVATFCLFYALPIIVLGQAFPAVAPVADPIGWAFALWGAFLYWWAGFRYASQTVALVVRPVGESQVLSDNVDRRGGRHGD
ncbi:MAG: CDP-alcohol phosphatidyltransferase family protein [Naasia sp.]